MSCFSRIETGISSDEIRSRAVANVQRSTVTCVHLSDDGSESCWWCASCLWLRTLVRIVTNGWFLLCRSAGASSSTETSDAAHSSELVPAHRQQWQHLSSHIRSSIDRFRCLNQAISFPLMILNACWKNNNINRWPPLCSCISSNRIGLDNNNSNNRSFSNHLSSLNK